MEPYRRRRRCLLSSPTTSSVPPASKPVSHALPCPPSLSASVDGVGRDGVRRPAESAAARRSAGRLLCRLGQQLHQDLPDCGVSIRRHRVRCKRRHVYLTLHRASNMKRTVQRVSTRQTEDSTQEFTPADRPPLSGTTLRRRPSRTTRRRHEIPRGAAHVAVAVAVPLVHG